MKIGRPQAKEEFQTNMTDTLALMASCMNLAKETPGMLKPKQNNSKLFNYFINGYFAS
jgi:hypothetical protein